MILGLIGVGKWGKNILATLEKLPNVEVKYLCAKNLGSLVGFAEKHEKLSDWQELLKKSDLDGVLIATPPETHFEIAEAFIKNGTPVFVEKPMVTSLSDARKLEILVEKNNGILMVGFEFLYNDHINYLKKEIDRGAFGKILEISYEHFLSPARADIGIFWDVGPHPISIFQYWFNPQKLNSSEGKIFHDSTSVKINFENAPLLLINASSSSTTKTRKITIKTEKAAILLDETLPKNKLTITINDSTTSPEISSNEPLRNELENFLHCIKNHTTPLSDVHFATQITEQLEAISNSKNLQ